MTPDDANARSTPSRQRLFIAVWPDAPTLDALEPLDRWMRRFNTHRLIPREQRHVTLAFLGEIEAELVPLIGDALRVIAAQRASFDAELGPAIGLPSAAKPRVVAVSFPETSEFPALIRAVQEAMFELHPTDVLRKELTRAPLAHLTLARTRRAERARRLPLARSPSPEGVLPVQKMSLMRSELSPRGPSYHQVDEATFPLGDGP